VSAELHPDQNEEESASRDDWTAGKSLVLLLLAGSIATFSVFYWRLHFELLHSVEAAIMAFPAVVLLLIPYIWTSKYVHYKGYDPSSAAILTAISISTIPFLTLLSILLYLLAAPMWVCFITPAVVAFLLASMFRSAKKSRS
jgi:hypothetical protein